MNQYEILCDFCNKNIIKKYFIPDSPFPLPVAVARVFYFNYECNLETVAYILYPSLSFLPYSKCL